MEPVTIERRSQYRFQRMPQVGDKAPVFSLPADDGSTFDLSQHKGKRTLLVFYPGDNTPVCTKQLCDYRDGIEAFRELNVDVVGISKDSGEKHQQFKEKHALPFTLLTDANLAVAKQYGVAGMLGMKRAVFLIDENLEVTYAHVEALALFRRTADELKDVIAKLK